MISLLHCGHKTLVARVPARRLELGASMSAIQSKRHFSCATSEQAHGDLHSDDVSSSSVSSLKHIQHLRGSLSSSCGTCACDCDCDCDCVCDCGCAFAGAGSSSASGCDDSLAGELSRSVCESNRLSREAVSARGLILLRRRLGGRGRSALRRGSLRRKRGHVYFCDRGSQNTAGGIEDVGFGGRMQYRYSSSHRDETGAYVGQDAQRRVEWFGSCSVC